MYYSTNCGNCQVANCTKDLLKKLLKLVILPKKAAGTHVEDAPHFRQNAQSHPLRHWRWLIRPFYFGNGFHCRTPLFGYYSPFSQSPSTILGWSALFGKSLSPGNGTGTGMGVDRLDPTQRALGAVAPLLTPPWRNKPYAYPRCGLPDRSRQADERGRILADWSARHTQERT